MFYTPLFAKQHHNSHLNRLSQSILPTPLHHDFQQRLPTPSPSTDTHPASDSNSTSTNEPSPLSTDEHPSQTPSHQSRPSQEILNDITTLALSARITEVAMSIQEVALALFQVQELRHSQSESKRNSSVQTSPSILAADRPSGSALTQVDKALMRLEKKVESTAVEIAQLETLIQPYRSQQESSSTAQSRLINDKFDNISEEWQRIQHDTEVLQDELKEDKWLVVFRAVSGQAEEMMESLEKVLAVSQEFVRETHRRTRRSSPPVLSSSPLRRKNRESHASSLSSADRLESDELIKSYNALIKNFHAKNKHYVPSCERVLGILSKGIKSRSTKNGEVLRRYADMNLRFTTIQENINRVGLDLLAVEKILQQASCSDTTPADCSVQASDHSFLQPPSDPHPPTTPTSPGSSSKTRKALNYLISTSPQFLSKHHASGISSSISPFRNHDAEPGSAGAAAGAQHGPRSGTGPTGIPADGPPPTHAELREAALEHLAQADRGLSGGALLLLGGPDQELLAPDDDGRDGRGVAVAVADAKARLAGAGVGDQARYAFWCAGLRRPVEEKSVMCKLVEAKRANAPAPAPELKVLVRTRSGWKDLDAYLHDCLLPS
ncbi:hypothetical protein PtA15_14A311 [Puccinia triticina]|uniref:GAR domain-containing protein n=1 Tax=Puccinia triticina TaxID=208348 RepID=A0ABY7D575_9BASI|nr:uncharacterized protein PtA15_14A311 [Puccinia triticina]WAQ91427.1 hypothetical protein PtA15_14A311 [Puccinia triticina]